MKRYYALIGAGGYGRVIMPALIETVRNIGVVQESQIIFAVEGEEIQKTVNGYAVISVENYLQMSGERFFNVAIANSIVRERIVNMCRASGLKSISIISQLAYLQDNSEIAEGAIISPFVAIATNVKIGCFFHANIYSHVAHDCVIGDYVTFAPRVQCNGYVHIQDHAYIGASAVIKNGTDDAPLIIGKGAVIGMGAVVTKNVPPFTTVVGNPAKPFTKKQ